MTIIEIILFVIFYIAFATFVVVTIMNLVEIFRTFQKHRRYVKLKKAGGTDFDKFEFDCGMIPNSDLDAYVKLRDSKIIYRPWKRRFSLIPKISSEDNKPVLKRIIWLRFYYQRDVEFKLVSWFYGYQILPNLFEILKSNDRYNTGE